MRRRRHVCGIVLTTATLILALGCGKEDKAEIPAKKFPPPREAPVKMKLPEMKQPETSR